MVVVELSHEELEPEVGIYKIKKRKKEIIKPRMDKKKTKNYDRIILGFLPIF